MIVLTALTFSGCSSKKPKTDVGAIPSAADADVNALGDSDSGRAAGLQTIHFDYDSYILTGETRRILEQNTALLKEKGNLNIQIEGHCDERGGIQYNIALGEKRANAVRRFLIDNGIPGERVTTISFGKERPINPASNEEAWNQNRRANFVVTSQ